MSNRSQNVSYLSQSGAQVNAMTPTGYTPLEFAIRGNCHRTVRVLLESSGYVPRTTGRRKASLVWLAVWYGEEKRSNFCIAHRWTVSI